MHINLVAPSIAPMDVSIDRTSPTVMVVSWTPLSYVEARGFISNYTVAYSPQTSGRRRRQSIDTMFQTVPGMDSSTTRIEGLDPDTGYTVQVSATTGAGRNEFSPAIYEAALGQKLILRGVNGSILSFRELRHPWRQHHSVLGCRGCDNSSDYNNSPCDNQHNSPTENTQRQTVCIQEIVIPHHSIYLIQDCYLPTL